MSDDLAGTAKQRETNMTEEESTLEIWQTESYAEWQKKVKGFEADDPRRLERGHWTVSFAISGFKPPTLEQLDTALECGMPKYSGWPPFTYLPLDTMRPRAQDGFITAYLGELQPEEQPEDRLKHCDFWRISRDGKGFLLRPMDEDREDYTREVIPHPEGPFFDWDFPIYRMTEVLKFIESLEEQFGGKSANFELLVTYHKTNGRRLQCSRYRSIWDNGPKCHVKKLQCGIFAPISDISTILETLVFKLLKRVYEQFEPTELTMQHVTDVVAEVLAYPQ